MKVRSITLKGFTLVELLIVIALIAILSVAVLATINPIEQTNKARDTKMQNDAAEVLGAIERYYASQNLYPWNIVGQTVTSTENFIANSINPGFGIWTANPVGTSTPDYTAYGELIATSELKGSFAGKAPFAQNSLPEDRLWLFHNGTTGSNYVCYFPKATANRSAAKQANLKCLDNVNNTLIDLGALCQPPEPWSYTASATNANLICVPEGNIN